MIYPTSYPLFTAEPEWKRHSPERRLWCRVYKLLDAIKIPSAEGNAVITPDIQSGCIPGRGHREKGRESSGGAGGEREGTGPFWNRVVVTRRSRAVSDLWGPRLGHRYTQGRGFRQVLLPLREG